MAERKEVLILHTTRQSAQPLYDYFKRRGDEVLLTEDATQAKNFLVSRKPALVLVDIHFPGRGWLDLLTLIHQEYPETKVIATNRVPDLRCEMFAKEQGITVFLREPFTSSWIDKALAKLSIKPALLGGRQPPASPIPKVRVSMRLKITLPYAILAGMLAIAAAYLVSRFVLESIHDRFISQLVDAGKLSMDWMVNEENRLLNTLRTVANTAGVREAVIGGDALTLREIVLPILISQQEELLDILNMDGSTLLSLHHRSGGGVADYDATQDGMVLAGLDFLQPIFQGTIDEEGRDKFSGLTQVEGKDVFYISGPIRDEDNTPIGVVLLGKTLDSLARQNRQETLAQVSFYRPDGSLLVSTLLDTELVQPLSTTLAQDVLLRQDVESNVRNLTTARTPMVDQQIRSLFVASGNYSEILSPWEVRGGADLGIMGTSLAENSLMRPTLITRVQTFLIVAAAFLGVIIFGFLLGNQLTQPLARVVQATTKVASGNLEVKVPATGNDEVAVLAHAFNYMVSGLQEGFIYRDILGRTVSPEVREALRTSFASGDLKLEGQSTLATIIMTDIRGFTSLSEKSEPATVFQWLNEYFGSLVPIVMRHSGVVDKYEGDAMLAFFGILPSILPVEESAYQACQAAIEMLEVIEQINQRRSERGEPPFITGISINTGNLTAGGLGSADRVNYTIIGDTVNTVQRMQEATRRFGESGVVVNETTLTALKGRRGNFRCEPLGEYSLPGKLELVWLYRLLPKNNGK